MDGASAQTQQLMERINSMKLESPLRPAKQHPPLCEVIFVAKGSGRNLHKENEGREEGEEELEISQ